ncbi:MAG: adenylate/guanylate cyclase domain-containing protein, partial [Candidatus Rokuibacteriota bacterium]
MPTDARFCGQCGHALGPPALGAPETGAPTHPVEKILTSRAALEGERKQVTVLFADVKGSMELLASRDPEAAQAILDPVLTLMMEAVHRFEGTVNQVMGDGIMALFGAPLAHEDHAVRACYAALRIQESLRRHAEELQRVDDVSIQGRVGLNSGEVVVRSIGSDLRMDYSAVGATTHLAARMEQLAEPGSILVSRTTLQLAEGYVQTRPLGARSVKGVSRPVDVYELTGIGILGAGLEALATRELTRFVGRDVQIGLLQTLLARAATGRGQVAAMVGEAGLGKSRLVAELIRSHVPSGWRVLRSRSVSYGKSTAYLSVIELLQGYFGLDPRDDPA